MCSSLSFSAAKYAKLAKGFGGLVEFYAFYAFFAANHVFKPYLVILSRERIMNM